MTEYALANGGPSGSTSSHHPLHLSGRDVHARHHSRTDSLRTAHAPRGTPLTLSLGGTPSAASASVGPTVGRPLTGGGPGYFDELDKDHPRRNTMGPKNIGRAIGARFVRAVKRGNLPFMLVFTISGSSTGYRTEDSGQRTADLISTGVQSGHPDMLSSIISRELRANLSALLVFIGALAGVGYVDPAAPTSSAGTPKRAGADAEQEFEPGKPVFDTREAQAELEKQMSAQRELEQQWRKAARPNAGAWMRDHRDDGARKQAEISPEEAAALAAKDAEKLRLHERNFLKQLEAQRADIIASEKEVRKDIETYEALHAKHKLLQNKAEQAWRMQLKEQAREREAMGEEGKGKLAPPKPPRILINPKTGEADEKGLSSPDITNRLRDFAKHLNKVQGDVEDIEKKIEEVRRRIESH